MKRTLVSLLLLVAGATSAQSVFPVAWRYQPTILAPGGKVSSCGIRFLGLGATPRPNNEIDVADASIGVHKDGYTVVKGGYTIGSLTNASEGRSRSTGGRVVWVRVGEGEPLAANGKATVGDDKDFYLYSASMDSGFDAIKGILEGKRIWLSFGMEKNREIIFSGQTPIDQESKAQFIECFRQLAAEVKK